MNAYYIQHQDHEEIVIAPTKAEARAYYQGLYQLTNLGQVDTRICTQREVRHTYISDTHTLADTLRIDDAHIRSYTHFTDTYNPKY